MERRMVGFTGSKGNAVRLLLTVESRFVFADGHALEVIDVHVEPNGDDGCNWLAPFTDKVKEMLRDRLHAEGPYPKDKAGYPAAPRFAGHVEVGGWNELRSYSDDAFLAVRGDNEDLARAVLDVLVECRSNPTYAGGYRGAGIRGNATEYVYHWNSRPTGD